jgi:tetratricopeptide (TPR) repeat protein
LQYYNDSIKHNKDNPEFLFYRGLVHQKLDQLEPAIEDFEKAIEKFGDREESTPIKTQCYFQKGICLRKIGNIEKSIEDLEKAVKIDEKDNKNNSSSGYNNLGLSFFESGRYDDAISYYKKAITIDQMRKDESGNKRLAVLHNNLGLAQYHNK